LCLDSFTTRGPQSTLEAFLATDVQQFHCDMCDRKFRKESELLLHKQTHLIEIKQKNNFSSNSVNNSFQCSECPTVVRSKTMLNRHTESVHGRSVNLEQLNNGQNLTSQVQNIGEKKIFLVENEILMIRDQTGRKILDPDNRIFD